MSNQCDNLVINELLCFLQCKIDVMDEISLVQICESNFKEVDIVSAKNIIFEKTSTRTTRKGDGKSKRLLQDIIKVLKETEPATLPTFVAKDLNRLPPVTFDYVDVTSLLKEILTLKQDVHRIQSDYIRSTQLVKLQEDLDNIKKNTYKQPNTTITTNLQNEHFLNSNSKFEDAAARVASPPPPPSPRPSPKATARAASPAHPRRPANPAPARSPAPGRRADLNDPGVYLSADYLNLHNTGETTETEEDSFTTVVNRKKKYNFIKQKNQQGRAKLISSKIKIVPKLSYIYVSRFVVQTSEKDIHDFIKENGHTVEKVEKLAQYKETLFSSFKITVRQDQESLFLSEDFWPCGIEYRRYTYKRNYRSAEK